MAILFDNNKNIFTLHTDNSTYQMQVDKYGFLLHLYYGRRTEGTMEYVLTYADRGFSGIPYDVGPDRTYSMDALPQEFPCQGNGDFRSPAISVKNVDGSYGCDLRYKSYEVKKGKYGIKGLPAVYADETEAETLEILLEDSVTKLQVVLLYGVLPGYDVITRSARIVNAGEGTMYLEKVQSACLDFVTGNFDLISFYGRHAMERNFQRRPVTHGSFKIGSRRGTSSHQYNPLMILARPDTNEDFGGCYGLAFVYSGSFQGEAEVDQYNQTRVLLGLQEEQFAYPLDTGEIFLVPETVLTYSNQGLGKLSQNLHRCYRKHLCRGKYKETARPILVNSWEAAYFNFDGKMLYDLAVHAAELGIEMLVMDDGWFGKRNDDNSSLGDWVVNEEKLGEPLKDFIEKINGLGMKFGIWFEPECVNEDSDLYREHPDWALHTPGRKPILGRNQLILDFTRKEVVDAVFDQMCNVLDQGNIEYVKWDMNRSMTDMYSVVAGEQGRIAYDYMLGLYDFLERLMARYPNLLIEGCSGGGGRFDAGMLYYTPQIWCSDNTDALDRIRIQYGTSFGYPAGAVGSHVSVVPNEQTGRITSLETRGVVAMAGVFGYEMNLGNLSEAEKEIVKEQVQKYRSYAPLIQNGLYYRLSNPFEDTLAAWEFVSEDGTEALVSVVMLEIHGNMTANYVRLKGLKSGRSYQEQESGCVYDADALREIGIPLPLKGGEYQAYQYYFKIVG
ncbi:alpha-galactosidase [Frisingicoccus sp.]|uniref:alpha-galactosidase n=1 Tax=Frisingicoccus sp. TaxID=1918627 RepID=UPI00399964A9